MKNLIKTGTRSISIADRAVAATMPDKLTIVKNSKDTPLPDGLTEAFVADSKESAELFVSKLKEIKQKWAVRYKTLAGKTTAEKREDYRVLVIGWAQENGAPHFTLTAPKVDKTKTETESNPKASVGAKPATDTKETPEKSKAGVAEEIQEFDEPLPSETPAYADFDNEFED